MYVAFHVQTENHGRFRPVIFAGVEIKIYDRGTRLRRRGGRQGWAAPARNKFPCEPSRRLFR